MKFSELTCCPFCGSKQFHTKDYMYGTCTYRQRFDGKEACGNENMYDGLMVREGSKAYCDRCSEYLGNLTENKVGKNAEQALKKIAEVNDL